MALVRTHRAAGGIGRIGARRGCVQPERTGQTAAKGRQATVPSKARVRGRPYGMLSRGVDAATDSVARECRPDGLFRTIEPGGWLAALCRRWDARCQMEHGAGARLRGSHARWIEMVTRNRLGAEPIQFVQLPRHSVCDFAG
jgi:hypothetical protein